MTKVVLVADADLYNRAAEILDERGWNQGGYEDTSTGAVCLLGALHYAAAERRGLKTAFDRHGDPRQGAAFKIRGAVEAVVFDNLYPWEWNDKAGRSKRQVQQRLRKMARLEKQAAR